ncbi:MAG: hypothetical protein O9353_01075 [Bacteroidia bacterium]|nr:hypothetical protein [Bacteroidia bacterium]
MSSITNKPQSVPGYVLGSVNYYKFRHDDFVRRFPDQAPPAYYMEYGDKYVRKFTEELFEKLSEEGKVWMEETKLKLQQAIEDKIRQEPEIELDDEAFKEFAFQSHSKVYKETHAMQLCLADKTAIVSCMDMKDLFGELGLQVIKVALKIS